MAIEEDDPFAAAEAAIDAVVPVPEPAPAPVAAPAPKPEPAPQPFDDPFASTTALHDESAERADLQAMLSSAREVVMSLEAALARAREHEERLAALVNRQG